MLVAVLKKKQKKKKQKTALFFAHSDMRWDVSDKQLLSK